jgi:hypothetical protein
MRKYLAFLMLFSYLFSTTELNEVLKVPVFIEHFIEHSQENPNLSFLGFIKLHYFNGDPKDADYETDMKLPFKKHDICAISTILLQDVPKHFEISFQYSSFEELMQKNFSYTIGEIPSPHFTIFQPPKIG